MDWYERCEPWKKAFKSIQQFVPFEQNLILRKNKSTIATLLNENIWSSVLGKRILNDPLCSHVIIFVLIERDTFDI